MGCSVYASTVLGIQVDRSVFWRNVVSIRRCSASWCSSTVAYGTGNPAKYCGECGSLIKESPKEEPTEAFANWVKKHGSASPQAAWEQLREVGEITVGIFDVNSESGNIAIGFCIGKTRDVMESCGEIVCSSLNRVNEIAADVIDFGKELGVEGKVEVFTCAYVSC